MVHLRRGDGKLEFRVAEASDHLLDVILNFDHLVLNFFNLSSLDLGVVLDVSNLLSELLLESTLLLLGKLTELFVSLDLALNVLVELTDDINLTVEVVDVVDKRVVLLFGLAEGGHDFFVRADSGLFLNLLEGVFNDLNISDVHVHQVLLLLVVREPFGEATLEELDGVGEFGDGGGGGISFLAASLLLLILVTFLEFLLELHNFLFENLLVGLVLGLEGQDLVVSLFRVTLTEHDLSVHLFAVLSDGLNLTSVALVNPLLLLHFLTHDVDLSTAPLVLSLQVTVSHKGLIELVLVSLDAVGVLSHLGR